MMSKPRDKVQQVASSSQISDRQQKVNNVHRMISAIFGSTVTALTVTPLDVVKTRLQSQMTSSQKKINIRTHHRMPICNGGHIEYVRFTLNQSHFQNLKFRGTLDGLQKIVKYEGLSNLWRGLSATLVLSVPTNVIYLIGYEHLRNYLIEVGEAFDDSYLQDYAPFYAGALSRTIAVTVVSPIEMLRTRLQSIQGGSNITIKVLRDLRKLVKNNGVTSLWRGLPPTLWRDVPFSGIYWFGYERIRNQFKKVFNFGNYNTHTNQFLLSFCSGFASGAFAAFVTTPFDVVKTWRQVGIDRSGPKPTTFLILKNIFQKEGVPGLIRGAIPRVLRTANACGIMISCYEIGKLYFNSVK